MRTWHVVVIAAVLGGSPLAWGKTYLPEELVGNFAFDWVTVELQPCLPFTKSLAKKIDKEGFTCETSLVEEEGSEPPFAACKAPDGMREFLIFRTKHACEQERENQKVEE